MLPVNTFRDARRNHLFIFLICFVFLVQWVNADAGKGGDLSGWESIPALEGRKYPVSALEGTLKIDGKLDEEAWQKATPLNFPTNKGSANYPVEVRFLSGEEGLFVGARLGASAEGPVAKVTNSKGMVWRDQAFEVQLKSPGFRDLLKFIVNANGVLYVEENGNRVDGHFQAASTVSKNPPSPSSWETEVLIPWKNLGVSGPVRTLLPMQMRYLQSDNGGYTAFSLMDHVSQWPLLQITGGTETITPLVEKFFFPATSAAEGMDIGVQLLNQAAEPVKMLSRVVDGENPSKIFSAKEEELAGGERREITLSAPSPGVQPRSYILQVQQLGEVTQSLNQFAVRRTVTQQPKVRMQMDRERLWVGDQKISGRILLNASPKNEKLSLKLSLWDPFRKAMEQSEELSATSDSIPFEFKTSGLLKGEYILTCTLGDGTQISKTCVVGQAMSEPDRERIPLKTDWPAEAQGSTAWPLYTGVSFPAGTLMDENQVRVVKESGEEIPCQSNVLAQWGPGGSIKWVGLRFMGQPGVSYQVEFGKKVRRGNVQGPQVVVTKSASGYVIQTGTAKFEMPWVGPLISKIAWNGKPVAENPKGMLLVRDGKGATATELGGTAEEAPKIEVEGKLQTIVRREGALRTSDGKILGRYIVRLTFSAGLGTVLVQHTFIMTQSSNTMQIGELSFRIAPSIPGPVQWGFDVEAESGKQPWKTFTASDIAHSDYWMFQEVFPHHRQTESRFILGQAKKEIFKGEKAGESMAVWNPSAGIGLTVPHLAQLFPKELAVENGELTAKLWSDRGGRLLDYRASTLADYVGEEWLNQRFPGGAKAFRSLQGDSISTARTHDLVFFVFGGGKDGLAQAQANGEMASGLPYVCQDPVWLQKTLALGPLQAYSPKQFPRIEAFMRQFFQQCLLGQNERFGDYGFLDYGAGPHTYVGVGLQKNPGEEWPRLNYRYSDMDYSMRTGIWLAYARSGERDYRTYAETFNRHLYDFKFSHWKSPERPFGAELTGFGSEDNMLYWVGKSYKVPGAAGHQAFDVENLLYQYYLAGDRRALEVALNFGEHLKKSFDPSVLPNIGATSSNYRPYGCAAVLYGQTWDSAYVKLVQESRQRVVDLRTITGLANQDYYGVLYKQEARGWAVWKDYEVTGSSKAGDAIVRLADYKVRGEPTYTAGYQDNWSAFFQIAYDRTGEQRFADWIHTRLGRLAFAFTTPEGVLKGQPYEGTHSSNVLQAIGYGLHLIAQTEDRIRPRPLFSQIERSRNAWLAMEKSDDIPLEMELFVGRDSNLNMLSLTRPERAKWMGDYMGPITVNWQPVAPTLLRNGLDHSSYTQTKLPMEMLGGVYQLQNLDALLSSKGGRTSLVAPGGLFYDASEVNAAPLYFSVPKESAGTILVNRPAQLHRGENVFDLQPGTPFSIQGSDHGEVCFLTTDSGIIFVQLDGDLPPVFARTKEDLFTPPGLSIQKSADKDSPPEKGPFGTGSSGEENDKAVVLTRQSLEIPRGSALESGEFEFFNTRQGTLEFWFKPSWSSVLLTSPKESALVSMGKWSLFLKVLQEEQSTGKPALVALGKTHLDWIVAPEDPSGTAQRLVNPHDFWKDTWHHIALCWETKPDAGWVSELFVDGKPAIDWNRTGIMSRFRSDRKDEDVAAWKPTAPLEKIVFPGTLDAKIDQIRISNICRYHAPFVPPAPGSLHADKNTLIYFPLDGNLEGIGPRGEKTATGNFR